MTKIKLNKILIKIYSLKNENYIVEPSPIRTT